MVLNGSGPTAEAGHTDRAFRGFVMDDLFGSVLGECEVDRGEIQLHVLTPTKKAMKSSRIAWAAWS